MNKSKIMLFLIVILLTIPLLSIISISLRHEEITPNDEFFTLSISDTPSIEVDTWRLPVDGLIENELVLTYENITSLPKKSVTATLKCVEGPAGRAKWTGVTIKSILDSASVQAGAKEIIFYAADGYSSSLTLDDATKADVILAYEMNGETLPADHGYPVRLVVPGKAGYKWVKWITHIEVVAYDYKGTWESRGWDDDADITTLSDWFNHATILSIGFIFGGLAIISGFKRAGIGKILKKLPESINAKFHKYVSIIYLGTLIIVFIYWAYTTYLLRGNLFYTGHGLISGLVIILHTIGGITGIKKVRKRNLMNGIHRNSNFFGFILYAGVIATGLLMAYGT